MKYSLVYSFILFFSVLASGQTKIKSFYFESDQRVPTPYSQKQLELFKQSFNRGEIMIYEIYAYTDSVGSVQYNDTLAKMRLSYVTNYLGIPKNTSISLKPYGLDRKYDVSNYKSWRRVDIYYNVPVPIEQKSSQDSLSVEKQLESSRIIQETFVETENSMEQSVHNATPYILNVEFIEGTARIDKPSYSEIEKLYTFLIENPTVHILIRGHVCCGNNMRISKNRAKAVYHELIKMGIEKDRLDFIGMSNTDPLVFPEKTNADRQKNRRVDVKFINM